MCRDVRNNGILDRAGDFVVHDMNISNGKHRIFYLSNIWIFYLSNIFYRLLE